MDRDIKNQRHTHYAVSAIGGFMGGYAIINFYELFANAQTANMIHLVEKLVGHDYTGLVYIFSALFTYIAGNVFCVLYRKFVGKNLRMLSLVLDVLVITAVGIITEFTHISFALLPILFAMPIQWNAFNDDAGYVSSTIFSTNNLRQATMSLTQYLTDKDKAQLSKTKFYWSTLLYFHIGVAVVCVASIFYGVHSIWFGFIPAVVAITLYVIRCDLITYLKIKNRRYSRKHKNDSLKSA
ncbi:MAG: DUF1275 domain-containing protein [Ruminococcus sp.]|nr:DUF1275 domain-containing protein [Ruminococcus sp.]